jgi:hypothetical protein
MCDQATYLLPSRRVRSKSRFHHMDSRGKYHVCMPTYLCSAPSAVQCTRATEHSVVVLFQQQALRLPVSSAVAMALTVTHCHPPDALPACLQGSSSLKTYVSLVARYGLAPLAYGAFTKEMLSNFSTIYALQDAGSAFTSVSDMLHAMRLHGLTQQRCNDTLQVCSRWRCLASCLHTPSTPSLGQLEARPCDQCLGLRLAYTSG